MNKFGDKMTIINAIAGFLSSFIVIGIIFLLYLFVRVIIPLVLFICIPYLMWRFISYWRSL